MTMDNKNEGTINLNVVMKGNHDDIARYRNLAETNRRLAKSYRDIAHGMEMSAVFMDEMANIVETLPHNSVENRTEEPE